MLTRTILVSVLVLVVVVAVVVVVVLVVFVVVVCQMTQIAHRPNLLLTHLVAHRLDGRAGRGENASSVRSLEIPLCVSEPLDTFYFVLNRMANMLLNFWESTHFLWKYHSI